MRAALFDIRSRQDVVAAAALKHVVAMETTVALTINDAAYVNVKAEAEAALRAQRGDWTAEAYQEDEDLEIALAALRAIDRPLKDAEELQRLTPPGVEDRRLRSWPRRWRTTTSHPPTSWTP